MAPGEDALLLSSSGDGSAAVWDLRQLSAKSTPVASATHGSTCLSAYFAPDGEAASV